HPFRDAAEAEPRHQHAEGVLHLDVVLEHELGAGPQADGDARFADRGKAAGIRVRKARRYQVVTDPRGPAVDGMQAVIAHGRVSFFALQFSLCSTRPKTPSPLSRIGRAHDGELVSPADYLFRRTAEPR